MTNLLYPSELLCAPMVYPLEQKLIETDINSVYTEETEILHKLMDGQEKLGFISPLSYARSQGNLKIVSEFVISSSQAGRNSLLFFKGALKTIKNIVYAKNSPMIEYHKILADYVLKEIFDIVPSWEELENITLDAETIKKHQVIFLSGNMAYDSFVFFENFIDMTEEWSLKMDLPVVHLLLCASQTFTDKEVLEKLELSREIGLRNLMKISKSYASQHPQNWDIYFDLLNKNYRFHPELSDWESLQKILDYCFYANVVDYLPEIKFLSSDIT